MVNKSTLQILDGPWSLIGTKSVIINSKREDLHEGSIIQIKKGDRSAVGTILKLERNNKNSLESDKNFRDILNASIGDAVEVDVITGIPEAEEVLFSVCSKKSDEDADEKSIRPYLEGKIILQGTKEPILEEGLDLFVSETRPRGIVKITGNTRISIISDQSSLVMTQSGLPSGTSGASKKILSILPDISFNDIGGLDHIKKFLTENIIMAIRNPTSFSKVGYTPVKGILLYGPPGTGKTALAMATAKESGANFIYVSASSFKDKYYGESERKLRDAFENARKNEPCILFIDEIDAIGQSREDTVGQINIVNQVLTLMDQIAGSKVFVIGCTNLITSLDEALIRSGRLFKIEVPLPDETEREFIFGIYLKDLNILPGDIRELARSSRNYSGADIREICNFARLIALREMNYSKETTVTIDHVRKSVAQMNNRGSRDYMKLYGKASEDMYDVS